MIELGINNNYDVTYKNQPDIDRVLFSNILEDDFVYPIKVLPDGYKMIEGIIFDGNCFFDTSINLTGNSILDFTYSASKACNVIGCFTSSSADDNFSFYHSTSAFVRYDGDLNRYSFSMDEKYHIIMSGSGLTVNDAIVLMWIFENFETSTKLRIGHLPNSSSSNYIFKGILYGIITVDNIYKWIPCIRESDGEIGYFETISGTFLTNKGSGTPTVYEGGSV